MSGRPSRGNGSDPERLFASLGCTAEQATHGPFWGRLAILQKLSLHRLS